MQFNKWLMLAPLIAAAAACGRNSTPALDDALKSDLALASQAQAYNPQAISPTEAGLAPQTQAAPQSLQAVARQPVRSAPARRTVRRSSSSGARSSGSSGGYYPAPAPPTTTVKHTQRDAAIGAAAGAVIGATSSRSKVRGGIIGAAVGGILGGVIGNNVDIQKKTGW
ncbi:MAG: YMGG-like glycine zipper-containing protein [Gemmatimonadales bacterium]